MAIALLLASCQWRGPMAALPTPTAPVGSAEQIAGRLAGHLAEPPDRAESEATVLQERLAAACYTKEGTDRLPPPQGVPAYTGLLHVAETPLPVSVRVWITSPGEAARLVAAVGRAAALCHSDVNRPFSRRGWVGVEQMQTVPTSSDNGDPVSFASVVARRGGLLAEVSWSWPDDFDGEVDWAAQGQGVAAATAILAAVGGDAAAAAPAGPVPGAQASRFAAALPPPSRYGPGLALWPGAGAVTGDGWPGHDLLCSYAPYESGDAGGVPRVERWLSGAVSIREKVLLLPDEQAAEQVRRRLVRRTVDQANRPCAGTGDESYTGIPHTVRPFRHGTWNGEVETLATRRRNLPPRPTYRDSAAQVALAVRRGSTVVYLRWQGPAGTDFDGTLRRGLAELTRTLDALP